MGNCYTCSEGGPRGSEITSEAQKYFFAFQYGNKFENTLFSYDTATKSSGRIQSDTAIEVQEKFACQVFHDVYTLDHDKQQTSLTRISNLTSGRPEKTAMRNPPNSRGFPAVCVYNSAHIFVSGGQSAIDFTEDYASVDIYDIGKDQWSAGPPMNQARKNHAMCALGKYIYVFSGAAGAAFLDSIERLDASAVVAGRAAKWENVRLEAGNSLPARGLPLVAPWSSDEIIYLGGIQAGSCKGDGYVVNVVRGTVKKCFDSAFKFTGDGN